MEEIELRKRMMLTLAALVACLVVASPVQAVTGNYSKDFVHDYVGLLVFYTTPDPETGDPFSHRCSGSLISPTIIVTAGHCAEGVDEGRVYFQQSVGPELRPGRVRRLGRRRDDRLSVRERHHIQPSRQLRLRWLRDVPRYP